MTYRYIQCMYEFQTCMQWDIHAMGHTCINYKLSCSWTYIYECKDFKQHLWSGTKECNNFKHLYSGTSIYTCTNFKHLCSGIYTYECTNFKHLCNGTSMYTCIDFKHLYIYAMGHTYMKVTISHIYAVRHTDIHVPGIRKFRSYSRIILC